MCGTGGRKAARFTQIHADADGASHFEEIDIPLELSNSLPDGGPNVLAGGTDETCYIEQPGRKGKVRKEFWLDPKVLRSRWAVLSVMQE